VLQRDTSVCNAHKFDRCRAEVKPLCSEVAYWVGRRHDGVRADGPCG
jgi:hypothetical protein